MRDSSRSSLSSRWEPPTIHQYRAPGCPWRNRFSIIIGTHVEGLDLFRIISNNYGLLKMLLNQPAFVFALQIDTPLNVILEFLFLYAGESNNN